MVDVARPLLLHKVGFEVGRDAWSSGPGPGAGARARGETILRP